MNRFIAFIKKEFYHILRDSRTLIIILGIPISQMLLFGFVIRTEIKNVDVAIYDQSKDYLTTRIINQIASSEYFNVCSYLDNDKGIGAIFKKGKIKEVVVFEPHFVEKLARGEQPAMQLIADAGDPNVARMVTGYTQQIVNSFIGNEYPLSAGLKMQINTQTRMFYNEELRSVFLFVPGLMSLILMLISALMSSVSLTREKEMGTMEVLLVSPLKPIQIILGKVIPYLLIAFVDALIIIALGSWVFGMPVNGSLLLLMVECFLFIFLALSLGIAISTIAPNQLIAMFISMIGLMLPTILLSGFIFPIENMPVVLQWFSTIMPARWFNVIVRSIMLKGVGLNYIAKETLILVGMTAVFILISVRKFKIRME